MGAALEHDRVKNDARQHASGCDKKDDATGAAQQKGKAARLRLLRAAARGLRKNKIMVCTCQSFPHGVTFPNLARGLASSGIIPPCGE